MKKLFVIAFCGMLGLALVSPVQAAGEEAEINPVEQKILDKLEEGITIEGSTLAFYPGSEEYEAMKSLLGAEGVDLTDEDYATIKWTTMEFQDFMTTHYDDIVTVELLNELIDILNPSAAIFGVRLGYDAVNDILNFYDADGNIIYSQEDIMGEKITPVVPENPIVNTGTKLENTGDSYVLTFAAIATLFGVMLTSGYSLNKRNKEESI